MSEKLASAMAELRKVILDNVDFSDDHTALEDFYQDVDMDDKEVKDLLPSNLPKGAVIPDDWTRKQRRFFGRGVIVGQDTAYHEHIKAFNLISKLFSEVEDELAKENKAG